MMCNIETANRVGVKCQEEVGWQHLLENWAAKEFGNPVERRQLSDLEEGIPRGDTGTRTQPLIIPALEDQDGTDLLNTNKDAG